MFWADLPLLKMLDDSFMLGMEACWRMHYYGAMVYGKCCYKPSSYFLFLTTNFMALLAQVMLKFSWHLHAFIHYGLSWWTAMATSNWSCLGHGFYPTKDNFVGLEKNRMWSASNTSLLWKKGSLCETLVVLVVTGIFIFHHHSFYPISWTDACKPFVKSKNW